ncbi:DNA-3-methyladenine glycosylase I [Fulvivirga kasyanovii]|uniref:DNA-3-methyladenine glycosylase I n=1 Tax=Fulvivirga kasyanovii TaxID=396812 RepID=A0ABW9RYM2_9BACT|nr:DNA-3-methyladenine glycosylase I [Fulvivirga kasyanovii]MTI29031.1 DNA-3-methyladenine glycosylase I [Fulvivirga kasyanovii]
MKTRCGWAEGQFDEYVKYHDEEWGVPVHDDKTHFEFLILEGAQAGLSWATILKKRDGYRTAFSDFDPVKVAAYDEQKILELIEYPGIVRNKLKIRGAVNNAKRFLEVQKEFGSFDNYIWKFVGGSPINGHRKNMSEVPATTAESDALSKDLKKRGFKFVGSTVIYAHMQACGLVNDHAIDCFRHKEVM